MMLTTFLFNICFASLVLGQAPGDFHSICRTNFRYRGQHDWIPYVNDTSDGVRGEVKWQVILDQYDYQNILGSGFSRGVWTGGDFDRDGVQFTQSGGTCIYVLRVQNTYRNANSNNWVFTQSVSYIDAIEVIVNATVRFTGCDQRSNSNPPCLNSFVTLHRYDTNSTASPNDINNTANYQPCFGDESSSRLEQDGDGDTNIIRTFTRPKFASTYFGIKDIGSFGDVQRVLVYYRVAQGFEQGLVVCPNIALPPRGSRETVSKSCTCKNNSVAVGSLEMTCDDNGACTGSPLCECFPGYGETQGQCQACATGQYRSSDIPSCMPCPMFSMSNKVALTNCSCTTGYYRANKESVHAKCSRPPASPLSLNVDRLTNVSCNLSWRVPSDEGGRNDTFYNITYMEVGSISGSSVPVSTVNTNYVIGNLKPVTTYQVIVTAENGVSHNELSLDQVHQRTAVVVCTTTEGAPERPSEVEVIENLLVLWQKPETPNGVITGYDVFVQFSPPHDPIRRTLDHDRFYFVFRQDEIPENVTAEVQVRAKTAAHDGEWSNVIQFEPFGSPCPDPSPDASTTEEPFRSPCPDPEGQVSIQSCLLYWVIAAAIAVVLTVVVYTLVLVLCCCCCLLKRGSSHKESLPQVRNPAYDVDEKK